MKTTEIERTLRSFYTSVESLKDQQVFVCRREAARKTYQVFYFDYSCDLEVLKDIRGYTRHLLARDYFEQPGSLQWNYYLAFLTDKNLPSRLKYSVENDDDYARKFVIRFDELDTWLKNTYEISTSNAQPLEQSLGEIWENKLAESSLGFVADREVSPTKGIDFILGKAKEPRKKKQIKTHLAPDPLANVGQLRCLNLIDFRPHPQIESPVEFRKVNLIYGENGVGKTSLLEAIEFFFTASNLRSNGHQYQIKAIFDDSHTWLDTGLDYEILRLRDRRWYKSEERRRGSNLNRNFNRFNFYNSDAAFSFAFEKSSADELIKCFEDIALGDEVSYLRSQMEIYRDKLTAESNSRGSNLDQIRDQIRYLEEITDEIESAKLTPAEAFSRAKKLSARVSDHSFLPDSLEADLSGVQAQVSNAQSFFQRIVTDIDWLDKFDCLSISAEKEKLKTLITKLEEIDKKIEKEIDKLQEIYRDISSKDKEIETLVKTLPYFENDLVTDIIGLNENIKFLRVTTAAFNRAIKLYAKCRESAFANEVLALYGSKSLSATHKSLSNKTERLEVARSGRVRSIKKIEAEQTNIENVYSGFQATAIQLLNNIGGICDCPLCGQRYSSTAELINQINEYSPFFTKNDSLIALRAEHSDKEAKLKELKKHLEYVSGLKNVLKILPNQIAESKTISNINSEIANQLANLPSLSSDLNRLNEISSRLEMFDLSERQFIALKSDLKESFNIEIAPETSSSLRARINNARNSLKKSIEQNERRDKNTEKLDNDKQFLISKYDPTIDAAFAESVIQARFSTAEQIASSIHNSPDFFVYKDVEVHILLDVLSELKITLQSIVDQREAQKMNQKSVTSNRAKISELLGEEEELKKQIVNLEKKKSVLISILKDSSEEDYLKTFLQRNEGLILDIFKAIHRPKEFTGIKVDRKTVFLNRGKNENVPLNEISSGQRSALALSIFLTLNRQLNNGPDCILFDDPITYVDDLNVLTFLDYLREIVLNENEKRQIFFATANENLAFLFEKKFGMLGDDSFRKFHLRREGYPS